MGYLVENIMLPVMMTPYCMKAKRFYHFRITLILCDILCTLHPYNNIQYSISLYLDVRYLDNVIIMRLFD